MSAAGTTCSPVVVCLGQLARCGEKVDRLVSLPARGRSPGSEGNRRRSHRVEQRRWRAATPGPARRSPTAWSVAPSTAPSGMPPFGHRRHGHLVERKGPLLVIVLGAPRQAGGCAGHRGPDHHRHRYAGGPVAQAGALSRHRASDRPTLPRFAARACPIRCWICWRRQLAPPRWFAVARSHAARPPDLGLPRAA